jgi:hypothetical protein
MLDDPGQDDHAHQRRDKDKYFGPGDLHDAVANLKTQYAGEQRRDPC